LSAFDSLYWLEQVHILSAERLAGSAEGVRIALIAGRANTDHPALAGASVRQVDARLRGRQRVPDDYTTALASLLVGTGNASPFRGIAREAELLVLHVLDHEHDDSGDTVDIGVDPVISPAEVLAAVDAAVTEGAQVICLPLGGPRSESERVAFKRAADLGVVIACPAGNNSSSAPEYPAAYPGCVSAAAIDAHGRLAVFSNSGNWVTTAAPGVDVPVAVGRDRYEKFSGTDFSCAILAATVALMFKVDPRLAPDRARDILRRVGPPALAAEATRPSGSLRILDAGAAVREAAEGRKPGASAGTGSPRRSPRRPGVGRAARRKGR
jgi:thermitase